MDLKERRQMNTVKRHPWEMSRAQVIADLMKLNPEREYRILDIGCGDLFLEEYLLERYALLQFYCVDIAYSEEEVTVLNQKNKRIRVYNNFADVADKVRQMDIVLLLDVVEHIERERDFLKELISRPFFTKQTEILITVPAFQCLYTSHDHFLGHYRRYSLKEIRRLVQQADLKLLTSGYFYMSLLIPRMLKKGKENLVGKGRDTTGLVEWKGGAGWTSFLKKVLTFDYRTGKFFKAMGLSLPGLSTYVLCRKKSVS